MTAKTPTAELDEMFEALRTRTISTLATAARFEDLANTLLINIQRLAPDGSNDRKFITTIGKVIALVKQGENVTAAIIAVQGEGQRETQS